jgi:hypothetical protein
VDAGHTCAMMKRSSGKQVLPLQALQSVDCVIEVPLGRSLHAKDSVQSLGPWYRLFVLATAE